MSAGFARLAQDLGIDMLIHSSTSKEEFKKQQEDKAMIQVWRASERNFGKRKDVLSVTLDNEFGYCWPQGFWADANYLVDTPINLKRDTPGYNFEERARALYADAVKQFSKERTTQIMKPFGCDMAYVDSEVNYLIMDELLYVWDQLGLNKDINLVYSTPTKYYDAIKRDNALNLAGKGGWPVRKDDTFPYELKSSTGFLDGFYSSRPNLKKSIRELSTAYNSVSRLLAQQVIRSDLELGDPDKLKEQAMQGQTSILELIGDLDSFDASSGT